MKAPRTARCSRARTPAMVLPPGEQTATRSAAGSVPVSMASCALQFFAGRKMEKDPAESITAGQALGQKNTGFIIWLGINYLTPVTSVAGGLYAIWHNLFNSWQLLRSSRK